MYVYIYVYTYTCIHIHIYGCGRSIFKREGAEKLRLTLSVTTLAALFPDKVLAAGDGKESVLAALEKYVASSVAQAAKSAADPPPPPSPGKEKGLEEREA